MRAATTPAPKGGPYAEHSEYQLVQPVFHPVHPGAELLLLDPELLLLDPELFLLGHELL